MASCFSARPSVCLGAAAASSGIAASSRSDGGSASSVLHPTRAAASGATFSVARLPKLGYVKERIGQEHWSQFWISFEANRGNSPSSRLPRAKRKPSKGGDLSQQEDEAEEELDGDLQVGLNEGVRAIFADHNLKRTGVTVELETGAAVTQLQQSAVGMFSHIHSSGIISTEALKAMLSEDDRQVAHVREKVDYLGEYLVQEKQLDAARFMLILRGMLDHEVVPQKEALKGAYKKAFDKIASVIEDSGWVLKQEGADVGGVEMVDDELMPPVLNSQY